MIIRNKKQTVICYLRDLIISAGVNVLVHANSQASSAHLTSGFMSVCVFFFCLIMDQLFEGMANLLVTWWSSPRVAGS